ncbi:glycosyltransferase family 2 protein [Candidatus Collierbacteria bacterium]|nr:glycosyltransferase family 2 protein [Candidatus Collierbacteria bacterium]
MKKIKLALVTINFNGLKDTLELLESILKAKIPSQLDLSIIVVDSPTREEHVSAIKKTYPRATILTSAVNLGFAAGNNLGIRKALSKGADWLMLINNDCLVSPDFFIKLLSSPLDKPDTGALGGLIYFAPGYEYAKKIKPSEKGKVIWYAGGIFDWNNVLGSHHLVDRVDPGELNKVTETDFVTGALFLARADVLKKVGLLNQDYFMYLEDVELCHRLRLSGYQLLVDPDLKIWHKVAQSSGIGSSLNDYFITRNRLLFGLRYASVRTRLALIRQAIRQLFLGTKAQKTAILDLCLNRLGKGSWLK